jgi:hypothetical protein
MSASGSALNLPLIPAQISQANGPIAITKTTGLRISLSVRIRGPGGPRTLRCPKRV